MALLLREKSRRDGIERIVTALVELNETYHKRDFFLVTSLFFLGIFLHQSSIMFGINISFADFWCVLLLFIITFKNRLLFPLKPLIFFFIVSTIVIATAVFYVPVKFMYYPSLIRIFNDYTKLIAAFIYFVLGYNLAKLGHLSITLKWYSYFGFVIGAIGVLFTFFNINIFSDILFYADTRFRGIMIDPNYFSILQITTLVYISRSKSINQKFRFIASFIIILSVITSGSKTGMITLSCYGLIRIIEYIFFTKKRFKIFLIQLLMITMLLILIPLIANALEVIVQSLASRIPSFARIQFLFTDPNASITKNGSERDDTWNVAIQIIKMSPIVGTGIGTYTGIGLEMFQLNNVAHNTFLQISAEWGIPAAFILFSYIIFVLWKVTYIPNNNSCLNLVIRDMVIIILIGSIAISLNNARVLWLFLGAITYFVSAKGVYSYSKKNMKVVAH